MPSLSRICFAILAAAATLAALACDGGADAASGGGNRPAREAVAVSLAPVRSGDLPTTVEVVGTLYGDDEVTISAKVPGRIEAILADVGDRVAAGAAIARIDPTDYQLVVEQRALALGEALATLGLTELPGDDFDVTRVSTVERARFQAANARAKLDRARQLFNQQPPLISEQDFADLETAYQVAERNHDVSKLEAQSRLAQARARASELATARQSLADTILRAPSPTATAEAPAGTSPAPTTSTATPDAAAPRGRFAVSQRQVSTGEYVREGDPLFRLVADDPIKFRAGVPERFVAAVRTGQPVTLRVEGYADPFTGTVSRINPAIDVATRTFQVEVLLPNADHRLRPGAFARGQIRVGQTRETIVPRSAVVSFAGTDKVFTVADNKAVEILVQIVADLGDERAVRGAFEGVDHIVITNADELARDVPVQVMSEAAAP